jgi:hypothetical protein
MSDIDANILLGTVFFCMQLFDIFSAELRGHGTKFEEEEEEDEEEEQEEQEKDEQQVEEQEKEDEEDEEETPRGRSFPYGARYVDVSA